MADDYDDIIHRMPRPLRWLREAAGNGGGRSYLRGVFAFALAFAAVVVFVLPLLFVFSIDVRFPFGMFNSLPPLTAPHRMPDDGSPGH
jgi:hypothetical protein